MTVDDQGRVETALGDSNGEQKAEQEMENADAESRQGFELWRSFRRVVCLTVIVRAPGVLSRLQSEMRGGHISDEMWELYMSRVLQPQDHRPTDPASPFVKNKPCFVVHRHKIRVMRYFQKAKEHSIQLETPLYIVQAKDEATRSQDQIKLTREIMSKLLRRVSPEQTKGLPRFLPLYRGMRLLLSGKDCARLGVVKGCIIVLRDIILADDEDVPFLLFLSFYF